MSTTNSNSAVNANSNPDVNTNATANVNDDNDAVELVSTENSGLPKSQFEELKSLILNVGNAINTRIDELESKISGDIDSLKAEDTRLADEIKSVKESNQREIEELKVRLAKQEEASLAQADELRVTNEKVSYLTDRLISLEASSYAHQQHGRGWNLEIDGIPKNIGDDPTQLEKAAIDIFAAINVDVHPEDIDTVHRLPGSRNNEGKSVIIRLHSRKHVRSINKNKSKLKDLKDLNINMAGLTENSRIYIRPNQCAYYKNLSYNCRVLKRNGMIERITTSNEGKITIKTLDGSFMKITHETDLTDKFPRFGRFNFDGHGGE